ncbi:MAG: hypothetical protein Ct9H300mP8_12260 [Gammaproteobacteria bacterium]|nr:MAG: hypothetical protein Ct9H300mP8_12260 [Gammaproteobacteria bacterium]
MCMSFEQLLELGRDYAVMHSDRWRAEIEAANPDDLRVSDLHIGDNGAT